MLRSLLAMLALLATASLPLAFGQYDADVDVTATNDADGSTGAQGSPFADPSATVVIVLIALAALVVALLVATASRPWRRGAAQRVRRVYPPARARCRVRRVPPAGLNWPRARRGAWRSKSTGSRPP